MPFFAFFFESVGGGEWLVLLAVVLIVVGPKNLPSAARKMGQVMSRLRRAADEFKRQLMSMDEEMRKAAEEVKKEYVQIPDMDGDAAAASSGSASSGEQTPPPPEGAAAYPGHGYDLADSGSAGESADSPHSQMPPEYGGDPDYVRREDAPAPASDAPSAPASGVPGDVLAANDVTHEQVSPPAGQS